MKIERLENILKKLVQMEDAEENLEMVPLYEEALALSKEIYGEYNLKTLEIYNNYGGHLRNLGLYEKAEPILRKAVICARTVRGKEHPDYATTLVNLANLLRMMKHWEESETLFYQALALYKITIGEHHFIYAGTMNNLGLLYYEKGNLKRAKECLEKSLHILEGKSEYIIPYATTLHNLVDIYKKEGNLFLAEETLKKEIEIYKQQQYEGTVLYAAALNSLGILYCEKEQYEKAESVMKESVEITKKHLGEASDAYKTSVRNLEMIREKLQEQKVKSNHEILQETLKNVKIASCAEEYSLEDILANIKKDIEDVAEKNILEKDISESVENTGKIVQENVKTENMQAENRKADFIKGLDLCRAYFNEICYPVLQKEFSSFLPRMAAGLIGEGSECYGFDDEISRDHDFGPSFQIYIPKEDMPVYGERLKRRLATLPKTFQGFGARVESQYGDGRVGVFAIEDFYRKFIAAEGVPETLSHWRQIPENALSTVTNGEVFFDNYGKFTQIREELKKGYPEDVRLKKIAARLMKMAQSGQYNFPRCNKRKEYVASRLALSEFMSVSMSLVYLLNHAYRPYYKWVHRGLLSLPILGQTAYDKMNRLSVLSIEKDGKEMEWLVEEFCVQCVEELKAQGLTDSSEAFLLMQGPEVLKRIKEPTLKNSNPWVE